MRLVAAFLAAIVGAVMLTLALDRAGDSGHTCQAPCVVSFGERIQEDEFGIDFHDGRLDVRRVTP
jgi:hypothetical protein